VSFTYTLNGPHVIELSSQSASDYAADLPGVREEVAAAAQTRANNTGHHCTVFDHDGANILLQVRPATVKS